MAPDISTSLALLAVILYVWIAVGDIRKREIPNSLVLGILVLGLVRAVAFRNPTEALISLAVAALVFLAVVPLFVNGLIGGGDAKLIPVSVLLVGYDEALGFLINMSLFGGVLSLILIAGRLAKAYARPADASNTPTQKATVPYGVAIAGAAAVALIQLPQG